MVLITVATSLEKKTCVHTLFFLTTHFTNIYVFLLEDHLKGHSIRSHFTNIKYMHNHCFLTVYISYIYICIFVINCLLFGLGVIWMVLCLKKKLLQSHQSRFWIKYINLISNTVRDDLKKHHIDEYILFIWIQLNWKAYHNIPIVGLYAVWDCLRLRVCYIWTEKRSQRSIPHTSRVGFIARDTLCVGIPFHLATWSRFALFGTPPRRNMLLW